MDQQVSPATVVVVLILVVAIVVALYFLVIQQPGTEEGLDTGLPAAPVKEVPPGEDAEAPAEEATTEQPAAEGETAEVSASEGTEVEQPIVPEEE